MENWVGILLLFSLTALAFVLARVFNLGAGPGYRSIIHPEIHSKLRRQTMQLAYDNIKVGDILRLTKLVPHPKFGGEGDLVRVTETTLNGVMTENKHGGKCEFVFNCGLAYLEETEWKNDFPD